VIEVRVQGIVYLRRPPPALFEKKRSLGGTTALPPKPRTPSPAFILLFAALLAPLRSAAQPVLHTDPLNLTPPVRQSLQLFYNLNFDAALKIQEQVAQQHPNDPMAWNYILTTVIFRELYNQDLLDTTYYAHNSFLTVKREVDVPQAARRRIEELTGKVLQLTTAELAGNPNDADALFSRGYAKGMHAVFLTLVDHSYAAAARQGLSARNDSEAALKIDPQYGDAWMAIGIQRFAVASLPGWLRFIVGFMGVGGNKQQGLADLRKSADQGAVTSVESRTILSLFLRHDGRYPDALAVERSLEKDYPHNYLFCLEVANLLKDEGHGLEAIAAYKQVLDDAHKPNYFVAPRFQLAWFGMADTERGYNMIKDAAYGYTQAAQQSDSSDWLRKRAALSAGQMYDLLNQRPEAIKMYQQVLQPGGDQTQAEAAHRYLQTPYKGK
jgi:tetratricopeptide (TPR) repeat protein